MAEVTQKHRELAWIAIGAELPVMHAYSKRFLETGLDDTRDDKGEIKSVYPITGRFAQALADLEAPMLRTIENLKSDLAVANSQIAYLKGCGA